MHNKKHHGRNKMDVLCFLYWWFGFFRTGLAIHSITMDKWPSQVSTGDNITLGCSFKPEDNHFLVDLEVAWHFRCNSHWTVVYHYLNGTEQLVDQDRRFHGRSWIVLKELNEEKASLRISNVNLADRGEYRCIVVDKGGAAFDSAYLTVLAPYSFPSLTAFYGNGTVILHCLSKGGYPEGKITWHDGKGEQLNHPWPTEYTQNPDGGFNINSAVSLPLEEFSNVCCSVIHTDLQQNMTICEENKAEQKEDRSSRNWTITLFAVGTALLFLVCGVTVLKYEKIRRQYCLKRNPGTSMELEEMPV